MSDGSSESRSARHHRESDSSGPTSREQCEVWDDPEQIRECGARILKAVRAHGYPEASTFAIRVAFEEAVLNALRHGQPGDKPRPARVEWEVSPRRVTITVRDEGPGFRPQDVPDPTAPDRLEVPSGRGIMLMRAYMTSVEYNERGNRVDMVYENPALQS